MNTALIKGVLAENKVLRNTFLLLATTLPPTIGGAALGVMSNAPALLMAHPWLCLLGALVLGFVLLFLIELTADTAVAIPLLWLFAGLMGLILSGLISVALARRDGAELVTLAALGTAVVMLSCSLYAMTTKRNFSGIGAFLFGSLCAIIIVSLLNSAFFHLSILTAAITCFSLLIFSGYMVYDVQRIVNGGETNYIRAGVNLYLNMVNIFSDLLQLLMLSDDD